MNNADMKLDPETIRIQAARTQESAAYWSRMVIHACHEKARELLGGRYSKLVQCRYALKDTRLEDARAMLVAGYTQPAICEMLGMSRQRVNHAARMLAAAGIPIVGAPVGRHRSNKPRCDHCGALLKTSAVGNGELPSVNASNAVDE